MPPQVAPENDESEERIDIARIAGIVFIDQHNRESSAAPRAFRGGCRRSPLDIFGREVLVQVLEGNVSAIGERVKRHSCLGSPGWATCWGAIRRRLGAYDGDSTSDTSRTSSGNVIEDANWEM